MIENGVPTQRGHRWILVCLALFLAASAFYAVFVRDHNRVVVRNSSGSRVDELRLVLRNRGEELVSKDVAALESGDSFTLRHGYNDFNVQMHFSLAGKVHEPEEDYVDLWTGEGWVIDIQANGAVESGYDYGYPDFVPREDL